MINVLVFGTTGMLGSMVFRYLAECPGLCVRGTARTGTSSGTIAFDAHKPIAPQLTPVLGTNWDYWINCIGVIKPHCRDNDPTGVRNAVRVNALFPHELASCAKGNGIPVIQVATDCVYSGAKGAYVESDAHDALDVYGKTKSLGEVFDGSTLNLRVSIIGPEPERALSLLEWFRHQPDSSELKGFTHHRWNGITTLRFAQLCHAIIIQDQYRTLLQHSYVHHYVPIDSVNKYELLEILQRTFGTRHHIVPVNDVGAPIDRTLSTRFDLLGRILPPMSIAEDISALRDYMQGAARL